MSLFVSVLVSFSHNVMPYNGLHSLFTAFSCHINGITVFKIIINIRGSIPLDMLSEFY